MEIARVILYLVVTIVVCPVLILPVVTMCTVAAGTSGLFQISRNRLRRGFFPMRERISRKKGGTLQLTCSVDADCPPGYVCRDGVCVPATPQPAKT